METMQVTKSTSKWSTKTFTGLGSSVFESNHGKFAVIFSKLLDYNGKAITQCNKAVFLAKVCE
jgi:hypothetical protein